MLSFTTIGQVREVRPGEYLIEQIEGPAGVFRKMKGRAFQVECWSDMVDMEIIVSLEQPTERNLYRCSVTKVPCFSTLVSDKYVVESGLEGAVEGKTRRATDEEEYWVGVRIFGAYAIMDTFHVGTIEAVAETVSHDVEYVCDYHFYHGASGEPLSAREMDMVRDYWWCKLNDEGFSRDKPVFRGRELVGWRGRSRFYRRCVEGSERVRGKVVHLTFEYALRNKMKTINDPLMREYAVDAEEEE